MAGTIQVQSCRKQRNLTLRLNKDLPPESSTRAMTENTSSSKAYSCSEKVCREVQNMSSDGEKYPKRGTCHEGACSAGLANGDRERSCRKYRSKIYLASYNERNKQIMLESEDQKKKEYNMNCGMDERCDVSSCSRVPVRKIVLRSVEENSYSRAMPSGNTSTVQSNGCNSQNDCPCPEDSLTKTEATNGALDTTTFQSKERSVSNSKTITNEKDFINVSQTNATSTGWSGPIPTEGSCASYPGHGQSVLKVCGIEKNSNEITATAVIDNVTYLKTPIPDPSTSNINQTNEMTIGRSGVTNTNTTYSGLEDNLTNMDLVAPLPQVPKQPSFLDSCGCNYPVNAKECSCKCTCPVIETGSVMESYDGTVETMSESDTISQEVPRSAERSVEPPVLVNEAGVQTSFVSVQLTPCHPASCPRRKRHNPKNLISRDVQTESNAWASFTAVEWKTQTAPQSVSKKITIVTSEKHSIPPKRSRAMEDRLLRRIMYFDSKKSSVCNKSVEFCTYRIHRSSKTVDPQEHYRSIKICSDCRSDKRCIDALSGNAANVTCDEIAIDVVSLELPAPVVSQLLKVCFFVYIDYVFLGHVGNETFLSPVSSYILFDSRKSYCVSMRFNKKERSILREQVNPTGLLAKDSLMFILVCHAAPEHDILKNWDYAYGYLSMKTLVEQKSIVDKIKWEVEMTKIGSTEKIGTLHVIFEGLKLVKTIRDEDFECIETRAGHVLQKLTLNKKDIKDIEKNR